jgi:hypothetical protein
MSVFTLAMFWRFVNAKKMEKEANTKKNVKIMAVVIINKGLKKVKVGNEKGQWYIKKEMKKEAEKKTIKIGGRKTK